MRTIGGGGAARGLFYRGSVIAAGHRNRAAVPGMRTPTQARGRRSNPDGLAGWMVAWFPDRHIHCYIAWISQDPRLFSFRHSANAGVCRYNPSYRSEDGCQFPQLGRKE